MVTRGKKRSLRIASYNIRKAVGLDWRRDPGRIARILMRLDADLVALQEADRRLGPRAAALCRETLSTHTHFTPVQLAESGASLGWHGNALLVGPGIRPVAVQRIPLVSPDPRGAVLVDVEGPVDMTIVAVHLSLLRRARRRQLAEIRRVLAKRGPRPTVIVGDFNEWRSDRGTEPLRDTFSVVAPGKTFHAGRPVAALDRFAYSDHFVLEDAGVRRCDLARVASDHLPIWADLRLENAAG